VPGAPPLCGGIGVRFDFIRKGFLTAQVSFAGADVDICRPQNGFNLGFEARNAGIQF